MKDAYKSDAFCSSETKSSGALIYHESDAVRYSDLSLQNMIFDLDGEEDPRQAVEQIKDFIQDSKFVAGSSIESDNCMSILISLLQSGSIESSISVLRLIFAFTSKYQANMHWAESQIDIIISFITRPDSIPSASAILSMLPPQAMLYLIFQRQIFSFISSIIHHLPDEVSVSELLALTSSILYSIPSLKLPTSKYTAVVEPCIPYLVSFFASNSAIILTHVLKSFYFLIKSYPIDFDTILPQSFYPRLCEITSKPPDKATLISAIQVWDPIITGLCGSDSSKEQITQAITSILSSVSFKDPPLNEIVTVISNVSRFTYACKVFVDQKGFEVLLPKFEAFNFNARENFLNIFLYCSISSADEATNLKEFRDLLEMCFDLVDCSSSEQFLRIFLKAIYSLLSYNNDVIEIMSKCNFEEIVDLGKRSSNPEIACVASQIEDGFLRISDVTVDSLFISET